MLIFFYLYTSTFASGHLIKPLALSLNSNFFNTHLWLLNVKYNPNAFDLKTKDTHALAVLPFNPRPLYPILIIILLLLLFLWRRMQGHSLCYTRRISLLLSVSWSITFFSINLYYFFIFFFIYTIWNNTKIKCSRMKKNVNYYLSIWILNFKFL